MFAMFAQFFLMFSSLFSAGNKFASALDNVAGWTEESSASFVDEAREQRKQKLAILTAQTRATEAESST